MKRLDSATSRASMGASFAAALLVFPALFAACRASKPAPAANPDLAQYLALGPLDGPADPVAEKLCKAFVATPSDRRASCCPHAPQKNTPTVSAAECTRQLSAAMRDRAIVLDAPAVDRCIAAMNGAFDGCDWIAASLPPIPDACANLVKGARPSGSPCRSTLECADKLRCQDLAPDKAGKCAPALEHGSACAGIASDVIATALRQDDLDEHHPECEGHCERKRCTPPISPDAPCEKSLQCDSQHHCVRQRCRAGAFAKLGEECTGRCAPGLRCAAGHCEQAPHGLAACEEAPPP